MAQVIRKFDSGGKTKQVKLFEVPDFGKYNQADLIKNGYQNIGEYIRSNNLKPDEAIQFKDAVSYLLNGIKNGTVTMDAKGDFTDSTGQKSSTGELERKKFLGIKLGMKNNENNAYGRAAHYLSGVIKGMGQYTPPAPEKPKPWDFNTDLGNEALGGNWSYEGFARLDYDPNTKTHGIKNRIAAITKVLQNRLNYMKSNPGFDYNKNVYKDENDIISRFQSAVDALKDGTYDVGDYNALARIGITDADKYFQTDFSKEVPQTPSSVEGQVGTVDKDWKHSGYTRTVGPDGKYHVYRQGTNQEMPEGLLPYNIFSGKPYQFLYNGDITDFENVPEQYKNSAQLQLDGSWNGLQELQNYDPYMADIMGQGYKYGIDVTPLTSLQGRLIRATDSKNGTGKVGYFYRPQNELNYSNAQVVYDDYTGQSYLKYGNQTIPLGDYNYDAQMQQIPFVDFRDSKQQNWDAIYNSIYNNARLKDVNSNIYKLTKNLLDRLYNQKESPLSEEYNGERVWNNNGTFIKIRKNPDGNYSFAFNDNITSTPNQVTMNGIQRQKSPYTFQGKPLYEYDKYRWVDDQGVLYYRSPYTNTIIPAPTQIPKGQSGIKINQQQAQQDVNPFIQKDANEERTKKVVQSYNGRQAITFDEMGKSHRDDGSVIKDSDKWRLRAAFADVLSAGLGFVPGANLAAAGIGAGASVTEFIADAASDGLGLGDVGRLAMNLGMDALSLIPGGKAVKAFKSFTKIKKSIPLLLTAVNSATFLDPDVRSAYSETLNKIAGSGKVSDLNTGDFKNLAAIAGTLLGVRNLAKRSQNWTNSAKSDTGKRRITATINGKEQSLDVSSEEIKTSLLSSKTNKQKKDILRKKFAEAYNKQNKLEGENAVKPEDVILDTKRLGTKLDAEVLYGNYKPNWFASTKFGNYLVGYEGPETIRGGNIPFSDAWFARRFGTPLPTSPQPDTKIKGPLEQKTVLSLPSPSQVTRKDYIDPSSRNLGRSNLTDRGDIVWETPVEAPNAKGIRLARSINSILEPFMDIAKSSSAARYQRYKTDAENIVLQRTINSNIRLDQFIEDQIPGGRVFGRARAKKEREYKDIFYPAAEQEQKRMWANLMATKQHDVNQSQVARADAERVRQRQLAEETKRSVDKAAALITAQQYSTPLQGAAYKAKQNMYNSLFNQRYYDMQEALRNKKLPHKKSNKKKKTSRDNNIKRREFGGILFKDGGLIPKYWGGNVMERGKKDQWLKADNTYSNATDLNSWDNYYDMEGILNDITSSQLFQNSDATKLTQTLNQLSSFDLPWKKQLNAKGYKDWNTLYSSTGLNKYFGEDTNKFDLLGPSTWNRNALLQTLANKYNSLDNTLQVGNTQIWNDNGTWKALPTFSPEEEAALKVTRPTSAPAASASGTTPGQNKGDGSLVRSAYPTPTKQLKIYPEDFIEVGRMIGGLVTNNRAANEYLKGLKPLSLDTYENYVPLQGNAQAQNSAHRQSGLLASLAGMGRYSDANTQLAGMLDISSKIADLNFKGDLQDAEMYYKTRMLGQQESDAAKARRVEISNKNRMSANAIDAAKHQAKSSLIATNFQNVLSPWSAGIENRLRQRRTLLDRLGLEQKQNELTNFYEPQLANLRSQYNADLKAYIDANKSDVGWTDSDTYKAYEQKSKEINNRMYQDYLKYRQQVLGSPYLFSNRVVFSKSGGTLSAKDRIKLQEIKDFNKRLLEDNKQYYKNSQEASREFNKMLRHMSSLTAELIKKAMT